MPTVTFRLQVEELEDLRQRAWGKGKSISELVREALDLAAFVPDVAERFEAVEKRLDRLEGVAGL